MIDRANETRDRMEEAGCEFVVAYFDEGIGGGKYGWRGVETHYREFQELLGYVMGSGAGLVVKTKENRNVPSRLWPHDRSIEEGLRSGRYVELSHGVSRNGVYAAEAALSSDICIGHAIGGTAVLESVLAGSRGLLLNDDGFEGLHDPVLRTADVLFPSMSAALAAIVEFRAGTRPLLGDWSSILPYFVTGAA